ncbi:hypothetical protein SDC9_158545 [bioreactor metagenome]|uniref:Uncharacterized protein n=1 Tax=bioreactor metagenome TaxID=1076179 RepID=A0A645FFH0_9ZZZZ
MLAQGVVDRHLPALALGIEGGQLGGEKTRFPAYFLPLGAHDDVGAGHILGMQPQVIPLGRFQQPLVLQAVFADQNMKPVRRCEAHRFALAFPLLLLRLGLPADNAGAAQRFLDLCDIILRLRLFHSPHRVFDQGDLF